MKSLKDSILDYEILIQKQNPADFVNVIITKANKLLVDYTLSNEKLIHDIVNRIALRDPRFNILTYELFRKKIKGMCFLVNKFNAFHIKKEQWDNDDTKGFAKIFELCIDFICNLESELEAEK